jgi:hypothetical protein
MTNELKWKLFKERREPLQAKSDLWKRVLSSMKSATIIIIKPTEIEDEIRALWTEEGAKEGPDFDRDGLINSCATVLIADTPVAYLPNHIAGTLGLYPLELYLSFDRFAPESIKARIGGGLRDVKVFAARAHATFDTARVAQRGQRTVDALSNLTIKIGNIRSSQPIGVTRWQHNERYGSKRASNANWNTIGIMMPGPTSANGAGRC